MKVRGFVNPCGATQAFSRSSKLVDWPKALQGLKVGFLENGKANVAGFFERWALLLASRGAEAACRIAKEGPMARTGDERYRKLQACCDLVIVGVCDGGTAASVGAHDGATLASRGMPVVLACTDAFEPLARISLPPGVEGVRIVSVPHPLSSLTSQETDDRAEEGFEALVSKILAGTPETSHSAIVSPMPPIEGLDGDFVEMDGIADEAEASRRLYDLGLSDGLPVFVPTAGRVDAVLDQWPVEKRPACTPVIHPRRGLATARAMAANAVMTGMPPALMPYLAASLTAAARPEFDLFSLQTTTNPVTPVIVVGGPAARSIGFNDGEGALGGGNIANATLGRALKLCMRNLGGARSADGTDPATLGQPGKYTFCFAENEDYTSWSRLREQTPATQVKPSDDSVTLVGVSGTINMHIKSSTAEELLKMIAGSIRSHGSNDYMFAGNPLLVLCPEHADILDREGLDLSAIQQALFDQTKIAFSEFVPNHQEMMRTPRLADLGTLYPSSLVSLTAKPEDILVCVSGGSSMHSTFMHSFGGSEPVSEAVALC